VRSLRRSERGDIRDGHRAVRVRSGTDSPVRYSAFDPRLQLWVAANMFYPTLHVTLHGVVANQLLADNPPEALDVPVSADIEAGYEDVAATVTAVLQAGAVGVNLEDRRNGAGLYESAEQADRLAAARTAADGMPFWINARTDVFLGGTGRIDDALERSAAYAAAGADSLFVPGLVDAAAIAELAAGPLPVAVMVSGPWAALPCRVWEMRSSLTTSPAGWLACVAWRPSPWAARGRAAPAGRTATGISPCTTAVVSIPVTWAPSAGPARSQRSGAGAAECSMAARGSG